MQKAMYVDLTETTALIAMKEHVTMCNSLTRSCITEE